MSLTGYFFQANSCLMVFYLFYLLLLHKETYFKLNRVYLISAVITSFAIPCLKLDWVTEQSFGQAGNLSMGNVWLQADAAAAVGVNWYHVVLWVYFAGVFLSALFLAYKLIHLKRVLNNPVKGAAFSFFSYKFVDTSLPGYHTINKHEETHVKQMHSLDVLLLEIAGIIVWFNPVIYLYKISIKTIHEYLADEAAAQYEGDKRKYALLLLNTAMGGTPVMSNPFIKQSLTKKRIFMLQKERSKKKSLLKYGLFLPLLAGLTVLSSAAGNRSVQSADGVTFSTEAQFPGGFNQFKKYLTAAVKYPSKALKNKTGGKVLVGFTVDTDGSLIDVAVVDGINAELDAEAVRIIKNSPKWYSAAINGQKVKVRFNLNVGFEPNKQQL